METTSCALQVKGLPNSSDNSEYHMSATFFGETNVNCFESVLIGFLRQNIGTYTSAFSLYVKGSNSVELSQ